MPRSKNRVVSNRDEFPSGSRLLQPGTVVDHTGGRKLAHGDGSQTDRMSVVAAPNVGDEGD